MFSKFLLDLLDVGIYAEQLRNFRWKEGGKKFLKYYVATAEFFYNLKRVTVYPVKCVFQTIC